MNNISFELLIRKSLNFNFWPIFLVNIFDLSPRIKFITINHIYIKNFELKTRHTTLYLTLYILNLQMEPSLKKPSTNSVGNWTPEEDEAILRYVYDKGKGDEHMMWGNLSETLRGRSGKSCRERWFNHLDPKIKRTEWSQEEQWVLFILRNQSSEKWSLISKKLMGRTDNAVKNYWNSRLKKRIDSM